jgi:hypothetical protein
MNTETIIEKFEEQEIAFDLLRGDLMVNATEMAKPFGKGKRPSDFLRLASAKSLIAALIQDRNSDSNYRTSAVVESQVLTTKEGQHGGTYMCEDLALAFAMWLSPQFHVWILKSVREIIFGNNPELVKEAVMNLPRIQKELNKKRWRRNRIKAALLGPERRKEMSGLISERNLINQQIQGLSSIEGNEGLYLNPEKLGMKMYRLVKQRDELNQKIGEVADAHEKLLVQDEYLRLVKEVAELESEQRHFTKMIKYSDIKFSQN